MLPDASRDILARMTELTRETSRAIDRAAQERLEIPGDVLMENAGAHVARSVLRLASELGRRRVVVVAGPGNNGGDGYVAARHLLDEIAVEVWLVGERGRLAGDAEKNARRWEALGEPTRIVASADDLAEALAADPEPLVVDALFGTGLSRPVEGLPRAVIDAVVRSGVPVLAVDLPSGLDCDTGEILGSAVRATVTVTFVRSKAGFTRGHGPMHCGIVEVASIGFPAGRIGVDAGA